MIFQTATQQAASYLEFIMSRGKFNPRDYGVDLDRDAFTDQMCEDFSQQYSSWSFDELLLHPREALRFCDEVRHQHAYYDVPDDIILRAILNRRKH